MTLIGWSLPPGVPLDRGEEGQELDISQEGHYPVGAHWSPGRLAFEAFVGGRAQRAVLDGAACTRAAT